MNEKSLSFDWLLINFNTTGVWFNLNSENAVSCVYSPHQLKGVLFHNLLNATKKAKAHPRLILSTAGWMGSGIVVRYLKVQCTSVGTLQAHSLGQSPLVGATAAKNNRAFNSHLRRYEALQAHALIVHGDEASTAPARGATLCPEALTHLETRARAC